MPLGQWYLLSRSSAFINSTPTCIQARRGTSIGVHAQGVGCECEAGASRGGPLVRSRHKLRDGRPVAQSRPVQWSQAAEAYSGGSSLLRGTLLQLGIFFGCNVYKCVQMCTAKAIFFRPSGSDNPPSTAKAALQASGRRVSIVVVQISFRDRKLPPWQMPRALDAERHAISQELPSHCLPVCRPCDSALACRQYRLLCAWSASFGKLSPWQ